MDNLRTCKDCGQSQSHNSFHKRTIAKDGLQHRCKQCIKTYKDRWLTSIKEEARSVKGQIPLRYAKDKIALYKTRSKSKQYQFNLTAEYLIELWEKQQGKCFYTNSELVITDKFTFWTATLDRLDPEKGYTKGNVAWTLHGVNCFKQELTLEQFLNFVNSIVWPKI